MHGCRWYEWIGANVSLAAAPSHNAFDGLYTGCNPYRYANRSAAAAACVATGLPRLCDKAEIEGYSNCAVGWCADWEGYWMGANPPAHCGSAGFNSVPNLTLGGAYCCAPRPSAPA